MAARVSKVEWIAQRLAQEQARGLYGSNQWNGSQWTDANGTPITKGPTKPSPFGRKGSIAKQFDKDLQRRVNEEVARRAPKGSTLRANIDSDCLESLTWKDGIATATFYRGGAIVYDYPMSRDEFVDWVSSGSLGKYGNANVF